MPQKSLTLAVVPGSFAICRLPADAPMPGWALHAAPGFLSLTRTPAELSVICADAAVPGGITAETGWSCLRIEETFAASEPGVVASVVGPLAAAGLSVFAVATFDTDHLLVTDLPAAAGALTAAGHRVTGTTS
ncbi:ACT domain-containing protein [Jidongwangia harbinensis]|uniref:ACT domain-containing protein n=1 Tax=Jidongwangia harbinensis TaxID=2878561 RepID=UPI001CDA2A33|nr:ACT domain-containing protein [Jidongwangia harbinensis]MCA2218369.1 ACT domain-containing protein [Jidongwangia harbinensis]